MRHRQTRLARRIAELKPGAGVLAEGGRALLHAKLYAPAKEMLSRSGGSQPARRSRQSTSRSPALRCWMRQASTRRLSRQCARRSRVRRRVSTHAGRPPGYWCGTIDVSEAVDLFDAAIGSRDDAHESGPAGIGRAKRRGRKAVERGAGSQAGVVRTSGWRGRCCWPRTINRAKPVKRLRRRPALGARSSDVRWRSARCCSWPARRASGRRVDRIVA